MNLPKIKRPIRVNIAEVPIIRRRFGGRTLRRGQPRQYQRSHQHPASLNRGHCSPFTLGCGNTTLINPLSNFISIIVAIKAFHSPNYLVVKILITRIRILSKQCRYFRSNYYQIIVSMCFHWKFDIYLPRTMSRSAEIGRETQCAISAANAHVAHGHRSHYSWRGILNNIVDH